MGWFCCTQGRCRESACLCAIMWITAFAMLRRGLPGRTPLHTCHQVRGMAVIADFLTSCGNRSAFASFRCRMPIFIVRHCRTAGFFLVCAVGSMRTFGPWMLSVIELVTMLALFVVSDRGTRTVSLWISHAASGLLAHAATAWRWGALSYCTESCTEPCACRGSGPSCPAH